MNLRNGASQFSFLFFLLAVYEENCAEFPAEIGAEKKGELYSSNINKGFPLIDLHAMQRANSTLEDFVSTYARNQWILNSGEDQILMIDEKYNGATKHTKNLKHFATWTLLTLHSIFS